MATSIAALPGYFSKTITFKTCADGGIKLDVLAPVVPSSEPATVLVHYHGGFLVVGDRYAFLPYWLINACVSRSWIFVTPEYRLLPEATAHDSLEDAIDAYQWASTSLTQVIGREVGSLVLAGSSSGAYLALATATQLQEQPCALLLIYGMLDATQDRYITRGTNIFGRAITETTPALTEFPIATQSAQRQKISAYPLPADPSADPRFGLVAALHIEALFPDYITGVSGLSRCIARDGVSAIPVEHRALFPLAFSSLKNLPTTIILHGMNDSAVPVTQSRSALEKLRAAGIDIHAEFPDNGEHGFDVRIGNINVEAKGGQTGEAVRSLHRAITLLDAAIEGIPRASR